MSGDLVGVIEQYGRPLRILLYGSTSAKRTPVGLVEAVAEKALLTLPNARIITGGFKDPTAISTDVAALHGAQRAATALHRELSDCYEALVPDHRLDDRTDGERGRRMDQADGITVREIPGRTPLGRRLSMVREVDMVVTFAGSSHTESVLEQAIELGVPLLPIVATGGASAEAFRNHYVAIEAMFEQRAVQVMAESNAIAEKRYCDAADEVVAALRTARVGRCLVLQPYDHAGDEFYERHIKPAVEALMFPVRLKEIASSPEIYGAFFKASADATAAIADITSVNQNVMYEVGYLHGLGIEPLLFTRDWTQLEELPIYFRTRNVHRVTADQVGGLIHNYLVQHKQVSGGVGFS